MRPDQSRCPDKSKSQMVQDGRAETLRTKFTTSSSTRLGVLRGEIGGSPEKV